MSSLPQDYFVNRDSFFDAVYEELAELDRDRTSRVLVIHGQAGIGKSALSIEIKRRHESFVACSRLSFESGQIDFVKALQRLAHDLMRNKSSYNFDMYHFSLALGIYYHKTLNSIPDEVKSSLPLVKLVFGLFPPGGSIFYRAQRAGRLRRPGTRTRLRTIPAP